MKDKKILFLIIGAAVILGLFTIYFLSVLLARRESGAPRVPFPPPVTGTITALGVEVEKAKLVAIARSYIQTKPKVHLGSQFVSWNEAEKTVKNLDIDYFSKYNPNYVYFDLGQTSVNQPLTEREKWWITEAAGKYVVQWDSGCDEHVSGETEGKCLPYYRLFVIIDEDLIPTFVDIIQFQESE